MVDIFEPAGSTVVGIRDLVFVVTSRIVGAKECDLGVVVGFWTQFLQRPQVLAIHSDHIIKAFKIFLLDLSGPSIQIDPMLLSYE